MDFSNRNVFVRPRPLLEKFPSMKAGNLGRKAGEFQHGATYLSSSLPRITVPGYFPLVVAVVVVGEVAVEVHYESVQLPALPADPEGLQMVEVRSA